MTVLPELFSWRYVVGDNNGIDDVGNDHSTNDADNDDVDELCGAHVNAHVGNPVNVNTVDAGVDCLNGDHNVDDDVDDGDVDGGLGGDVDGLGDD